MGGIMKRKFTKRPVLASSESGIKKYYDIVPQTEEALLKYGIPSDELEYYVGEPSAFANYDMNVLGLAFAKDENQSAILANYAGWDILYYAKEGNGAPGLYEAVNARVYPVSLSQVENVINNIY